MEDEEEGKKSRLCCTDARWYDPMEFISKEKKFPEFKLKSIDLLANHGRTQNSELNRNIVFIEH